MVPRQVALTATRLPFAMTSWTSKVWEASSCLPGFEAGDARVAVADLPARVDRVRVLGDAHVGMEDVAQVVGAGREVGDDRVVALDDRFGVARGVRARRAVVREVAILTDRDLTGEGSVGGEEALPGPLRRFDVHALRA